MGSTTENAQWLLNKVPQTWYAISNEVQDRPWFSKLATKVRQAYETTTVYPSQNDIFRALDLPPENIRVVILGRDPYPQEGLACGLAFSAPNAHKPTSSLSGIERELVREGSRLSRVPPYDLRYWADQGVLLLNCTLTIGGDETRHEGWGWAYLTSAILRYLDSLVCIEPLFLLWGHKAQQKACHLKRARIDNRVFKAAHPCTFNFVGCDHFRLVNDILRNRGEQQIQW